MQENITEKILVLICDFFHAMNAKKQSKLNTKKTKIYLIK
jgi:hypothetical protein